MKYQKILDYRNLHWSPSMRREWIEMQCEFSVNNNCKSPSMRREWIEINFQMQLQH